MMRWEDFHHLAEEFDLWSSVLINAWLLLTAAAIAVSWAIKGKLSEKDILVVAGLMLALVGLAAFVAIGWVVFFAAIYQSLFGPPPYWLVGITFAATTAGIFWFFWTMPPRR